MYLFQGTFRMYYIVKYAEEYRSLADFTEYIYFVNRTPERSKILKNHVEKTYSTLKIILLIDLVAFFLMTLSPIYIFVSEHRVTLLYSIHLPFVNHEVAKGLAIHFVFQMIISAYAVFGFLSFDEYLAMVFSNVSSIVSILECQLKDFDKNYKKMNESHRIAYLKNVLVQFGDFIR